MSLDHSPSSRSFASRFLLAPRTTAAAVLALGLGFGAVSAHADETAPAAPAAAVTASPEAAPSADIDRPLDMHDLSATSSIGLRAEGGYLSRDRLDTTVHGYTGSLIFDGELAITPNLKLMASFPVTGAMASDSHSGDNTAGGHGNLTLGAQVQGSEGNVAGAFGGSISNWADDDGFVGIYNHYNLPMFFNGGQVAQLYGTARGGSDDGFIQGELTYTDLVGETDSASVGQLTIGVGTHLDGDRVLMAELSVLRSLEDNPGNENLYLSDLGMRGSMGEGSTGSWGAKLSLVHAEGLTTFGVAFDWRTDLPMISGQ